MNTAVAQKPVTKGNRAPRGKAGAQVAKLGLQTPPVVNNVLNSYYSQIDQTLENLKTVPKDDKIIRPQFEAHLEGLVNTVIVSVKSLILANAQGEPNGFRCDNTGFLTGNSDYGKPAVLEKYPDAYLVNQYALEIVERMDAKEKASTSALDKSSPVTSTELAKIISAGNAGQEEVIMTLKDDSKLLLNQKTGDIGAVNPETGKVTWYRNIMEKGKDWGARFCNWFMTMCYKVWDFLTGFIRKGEDAIAEEQHALDQAA